MEHQNSIEIFIEEDTSSSANSFEDDPLTNNKAKASLDIPSINWEELYEEKNRTNQIEANIRKAQAKEAQCKKKRLVRKITPSQKENQHCIEKFKRLRTLRNSFHEVVEEEEDQ